MKKILFGLCILFTLVSCSKEQVVDDSSLSVTIGSSVFNFSSNQVGVSIGVCPAGNLYTIQGSTTSNMFIISVVTTELKVGSYPAHYNYWDGVHDSSGAITLVITASNRASFTGDATGKINFKIL